MILSASYNFYNGEEHLKASLQSIRNQVDYITIVYQKQSNAGNPISDEALTILHDVKKEKLCDKLIEFTPNLNKARQENELEKRRIGLQAALRKKCSHFFTIDADEFYREKELKYAKDYIEKNRILATSCCSFFHLKRPIYRSKDITCCSFITKLSKEITIGGDYYIPYIDPTRSLKHTHKTVTNKFLQFFSKREIEHHHFNEDIVAMYHMNFVRKDNLKRKANLLTLQQLILHF